MNIHFRLIFRANGQPTDPFKNYSKDAIDAALAAALPEDMQGTIEPSLDSKNQPAVLVKACANSVNSMYELRSQVVSGEFMHKLTRSLKIQIRSEKRELKQPSTREEDEIIEKTEAGALDLTMTHDEDASLWEKLKFAWPFQGNEPDKTKQIKRELREAKSQLDDKRKEAAVLESRVAELIERLATEARSDTPRDPSVNESVQEQGNAEHNCENEIKENVIEEGGIIAVGAEQEGSTAESSSGEEKTTPALYTPKTVGAEHVVLSELTASQHEMIKELSTKYQGAGGKLDEFGDIFILRFLVANGWKMHKAEKQVLSTARWRQRHHADEFREQIRNGLRYADIPHVREIFRCVSVANYLTETEYGDIMTVIDYGSLNVDRFFSLINNAEYFDVNTFILEYLTYHADKASRERGHLCRQAMCIDAEGIGLKHVSLRMFIRFKPVMPLADLYYPELLGAARVINAAWALHQGWKLVKPLLSKEIQAMVKILDKAHSQKALTALANPKDLPPCYNGTASRLPARFAAAVDCPDHPQLDEISPGTKLGPFMRATLVKPARTVHKTPNGTEVPRLRSAAAA